MNKVEFFKATVYKIKNSEINKWILFNKYLYMTIYVIEVFFLK